MRRLASIAAALLAAFPGIASAATPCLTSSEFASIAQFALPGMIDGARERCGQVLASDAFLTRGGAALAARYAADGRQAWPLAKAAFLKLSDTGNADANTMLRAMPDDALQQMLLGMIEGLVVSQMPLDTCGMTDRIIALLAPLPAANAAGLIATLVQIGVDRRKGDKIGPLSICPA